MPVSKVQITGGGFQDFEGNTLADGYLLFEINQDELASGVGQICHGQTIRVDLDVNGNVLGTVFMWPNDVLTPANSYYTVTGYTAEGQLAWGPNVQQITGSSPFDLGTWVPNQITTWNPPIVPTVLETNGVNNPLQTVLNLIEGNNITLTSDSNGGVTIDSTATGFNPLSPAQLVASNDYMQQGIPSYQATGEQWRSHAGGYSPPTVDSGNWGSAPFAYPPPYMGIARLITSTAANTGCSMDANGGGILTLTGSTRTMPYIVPNVYTAGWTITFLFNLIGPLTNVKFAMGFRDGVSTYPNPANGLQIGYDSTLSDVNWTVRSFANAGSGVTRATTSLPVATGWHKVVINGGTSNSVQWIIDGIVVATTLSDYSYSNYNQHPFISLYTTNSVAKIIDLDFYSFGFPSLNR